MTQLGESIASRIAKKADLPRTTAISILDNLEKENYISIHKYRGKHHYWIESPHMIKDALVRKVEMAENLNSFLSDLYRAEADFPYAKIYDSKSSIRTFIKKMIFGMKRNEIIFTIDNPKSGNYEKTLSEDFYYLMLEMKNKKHILTKTLVPFGVASEIDKKKIESQSIVIREMPREINFKSSLWIVGDRLVLFSGKYPFVVTVKHKIITESVKSIFDFLWNISREK